jgi:hypothetical protein
VTRDEHAGRGRRGIDPPIGYGSRPVNPYIAGAPVSGAEMFYGRDDVFAFIQHKLIGRHQDTPIVLKGERRTGKTSVLYQVRRHLDSAYRCVTIDLHGLSLNGIGDLLNGLANSISDSLWRDYELYIPPPGRDVLEADPRTAFESAFLSAVLAALGRDHLVLMLDEVARLDEEIQAGRLDREVFSYLRHLMQHHPRLNFIFSLGSGLEEMQKDYAFMFSAAMYHQISFLEEPAARRLITEPVRGYFEILPEAVDTILKLTSGHPYYTQLVCHSLFDRWVSQAPKPTMTAEDVHAVLGEAIELGSPNLTFVWEDSTPEEKAVMAAMAAAMRPGPRPVTGRTIRKVGRKGGVPLPERNLSAALRSLASREVITRTEPYSFTVDLQRLWLDKHRPLPWLKDELAQSIDQWARAARNFRARNLVVPAAVVVIGCLAVAVPLRIIASGDSNNLGAGSPTSSRTATTVATATSHTSMPTPTSTPDTSETPTLSPKPTETIATLASQKSTQRGTAGVSAGATPTLTATIRSPGSGASVETDYLLTANGTVSPATVSGAQFWFGQSTSRHSQGFAELAPDGSGDWSTQISMLCGGSGPVSLQVFLVPAAVGTAFSNYAAGDGSLPTEVKILTTIAISCTVP